jgi:hypothetical protein
VLHTAPATNFTRAISDCRIEAEADQGESVDVFLVR